MRENAGETAPRSPSSHPGTEHLQAFALGQLPEPDEALVEAHLIACDTCWAIVEDTSQDEPLVRVLRSLPRSGLPISPAPGECQAQPPSTPKGEVGPPFALVDHPRYELLELIGSGGMGQVWKARHRLMNRRVALKLIQSRLFEYPGAVARFQREVEAAARLDHPNLVRAFDAEQVGALHFLVMEFVEGMDLGRWVRSQGPLSVPAACDTICQAALGLQHAHDHHIVHRDIKPGNLMRAPDGQIKILDFGLAGFRERSHGDTRESDATLTSTGEVMGTPSYLAPEQAQNSHEADARADVYGLGGTLYFLLAGQPPFHTATDRQLDAPLQFLRRLRKDAPEALLAVLAKMLAPDPTERFQTAAEVRAALTPFARRSSVRTISRRWLLIATALVGIGATSFVAPTLYRIVTDKGVLLIECTDPQVKVIVKRQGATVIDPTSRREIELTAGDYEIEVADPTGWCLSSDRFTIKRNGQVAVRAWLEPVGPVREFKGHTDLVRSAVFSPDGRRMLTGSKDGSARLWNTKDGQEVRCYRTGGKEVVQAAFSPDGRRIFASCVDRTIRIWDANGETEQGRLEQATGSLSLSPDGRRLLTRGQDADTVLLWDVVSRKLLQKVTVNLERVVPVVLLPNGVEAFCAGWGDGGIRLMNLEKGQEVRYLEGHDAGINALALSPDARQLFSGGHDGKVRAWDVETGKEKFNLPGHRGAVYAVAVSPDAQRLVSAGKDRSVRVWDVAAQRQLACFEGHTDAVWGVAVSPDGQYAVSASEDRTVRLWRLPAQAPGPKAE